MFEIDYDGKIVHCQTDETLLESLLRTGIEIDFSCKSGVCHRCMTKCIEGEIPEAASKKLPMTHQGQNYLLACQCRPTSNMTLAAKTAEDQVTKCMAVALVSTSAQTWQLLFEAYRELNYQQGQTAFIYDVAMQASMLVTFVSDPQNDYVPCVEMHNLTPWLQQESSVEGMEFYLRGPLTVPPEFSTKKLQPNPRLWQQLGGDEGVRTIIQTFYDMVYADEQLAPFFERVTIDRIVGKQFAFLKENIMGEAVYMGELPRNAHNWMVIDERLFRHRMSLMQQAMRKHGLADELIVQLEQYETQFKPDIVKAEPWPKQVGEQLVYTEQYEECRLDEATVCDYCGGEILANTMVKFHKRLGKLACETCSGKTIA